MKKIVGIGACVMDTLVTVPQYPEEDTKLRAENTKQAGGGPTATGLVAAAKLGESAAFLGVLSDDGVGSFLKGDFEKYGVGTENIRFLPGYRAFTSTIWLAKDKATRTCVFDKGNLPKLELNEAQAQAIRDASVLMVDGNELDAAVAGAQIAHESGTKVLYDCGGLYPNVELLLKETDYMIPSAEFAKKHTHTDTLEDAAKTLLSWYRPEFVVITDGKNGGLYADENGMRHYPAFPVDAVDTNGSGDVFHGAFAFGLCHGFDPQTCCLFSSAVSALKCTGIGARESVPSYEKTINFLKENGYEL